MSSNAYSVVGRQSDQGSDDEGTFFDEEDIVLGNVSAPTKLDRSLLVADEEALHGLSRHEIQTTKPSFFSRAAGGTFGYNRYTQLASPNESNKKGSKNKRKRGSRAHLGSRNVIINPNLKNGGTRNSRPAYQQHAHTYSQNSDESDSDYPSDIEIDIRSRPRRNEIGNRARKLYWALLLCLAIFGFWLFVNNLRPFGTKSSSTTTTTTAGSNHVLLNHVRLSNGTHVFRPTTIVISLEGMHPHYVSADVTPHLHKLMSENSVAPYMIPPFPSTSLPMHWTMATGFYPANHGIVANSFYDVTLESQFRDTDISQNVSANSLDPRFWGGEPIWQTASLQGLTSAVHLWPGNEVSWRKKAPILIDNSVDDKSLVKDLRKDFERIVSWIDLDLDNRPELIMSRVPAMQTAGHIHGIQGKEIIGFLKNVDSYVATVLEGLESRNLTDIVNLVVVSDSGMAPTSEDRLIFTDELIHEQDFDHVDGFPLLGLRPNEDASLNYWYKSLLAHQKESGEGKWDVYLRENLPQEYKLGGDGPEYNKYKQRIAPLWLVPRPGWSFTTKKLHADSTTREVKANQGYNNTDVLMRALFVAKGPYFQSKRYLPFESIGLYNILCDTLNIKPSKNDGSSLSKILTPLPINWADQSSYPGLPFEVEILPFKSTSDELFGHGASNLTAQSQHAGYNNSTSTASNTVVDTSKEDTKEKSDKSSATAAAAAAEKWWKEWYGYAQDKASDAKDWVKDKISAVKGTSTSGKSD